MLPTSDQELQCVGSYPDVIGLVSVTYAFYAVLKIDGMTNATRVPVILHDMGMQWPKES